MYWKHSRERQTRRLPHLVAGHPPALGCCECAKYLTTYSKSHCEESAAAERGNLSFVGAEYIQPYVGQTRASAAHKTTRHYWVPGRLIKRFTPPTNERISFKSFSNGKRMNAPGLTWPKFPRTPKVN